jgi:hypothetical protein
MGGLGSGRWGFHRRARTVEECLRIDLARVVRGAPPAGAAGVLRWFRGEREAGAVVYELGAGPGGRTLRLTYQVTPGGTEPPRPVALDVALERAAVPRGGFRWWGRCPLAVNGVACGRRVATLYLPPGADYFGCRACHRLSYRSRQEHDPRVTRLLKDPAALARLSANVRGAGVTQLGILLKALTVQQARDEREFRRFEKRYGQTGRGTDPGPQRRARHGDGRG